jgi:hypothetical protein
MLAELARIRKSSVAVDMSTDSCDEACPTERSDCSTEADTSSVVARVVAVSIFCGTSELTVASRAFSTVAVIEVFRDGSIAIISSPDFEPYGVTPYEEPPYVIYSQVLAEKSDSVPLVSIPNDLPLGT